MLADGKLSMPAPPVPEAFSVYLMEYDGPRWYPAPPVGWPAALALGTLAGVPWLVNPLLGGANLILAYLILVELYDRRTARLAVFLLAFSPWFIFMAMNYMTHTFTLTCALMAVLGIIHARRTGRLRWALAAGLALGVCSLIRPLEGLIMAGLLGLWSLGIGGSRLSWSSLTGLVFSTGVIAAIVFPYNQLLTGSWKVFPINKYTDEVFGVNSNAYGFGPDRGMGWPIDPFPGHSPLDATINSDLNTFQLNVELFGWSTGSLWPVLLWLFVFRFKKADFLMAAVIGVIFVAFFFYYFSGGPDFGARYWYLMIIPLVALSARGLEEITARWSFNPAVESLAGARVWLAVISLCLMALVNFLPWRALDKYFHYLGMRPDLQRIAQETPFGRSLVLVQGSENPDYASAAVYNPLDFTSPVPIYAWDKTPNIRTALLRSFADRPVWIVEGPTLTGKGFQTTAGPMTANQLLMQMGEQP
jgi:4-amino-4-deoxy-L-arabinose transferase-like glycosyltransferase